MNDYSSMMGYGYSNHFGLGLLLLPVMLWSIFWKGLALWHSAKHKQHWWFMALLVINTAGILEIVYLFAVLKVKTEELFKK